MPNVYADPLNLNLPDGELGTLRNALPGVTGSHSQIVYIPRE